MDRSGDVLNNSNLPMPSPPHPPTYALYGEHGVDIGADRLHCESIAERSRRHDWHIRPHRHEVLFQILYLRHGVAEALVEGRALALASPALIVVPALATHGFRFADDVDGLVVTVLEPHLRALLAGAPALLARLQSRPLHVALAGHAGDAAQVDAVLQRLRDEFAAWAPWRALAIDGALLQLLALVGRLVATPVDDAAGERALVHLRRFRDGVEARFREQPALGTLAAELGITATQLNRVCRRVLGHSALEVLHQRLLLEAQRELAYTTLSIKQIAYGIGFSDAGYFTRFFQRKTGLTPTAWRARSRRAAPAAGAA